MKRVAEPMRHTALMVRRPTSLNPPERAPNMSAANSQILAVGRRTVVEWHRPVRLAVHELVYERFGGFDDLSRCAFRHDLASGQEVDVVHDLHGLLDVVGDDDRRRAER